MHPFASRATLMQLRSVLLGGTFVVTGLVIAACSSSDDDTDDACTSSGKRVCERACACGSGSECKTGYANDFGSFTTFTWSDRADCEAGYAGMRCKNGGPAGVDYGACTTAIDSTSCNADVFVVPASCEAPRNDGGK